MKSHSNIVCLFLQTTLLTASSCDSVTPEKNEQNTMLKVETLFNPIPFKQSGRNQLCYELWVSTNSTNPIKISKLTGHDHSGTELFSYDADQLQKNSIIFKTDGTSNNLLTLLKQDLMAIYIWIDSKTPFNTPFVKHKLHYSHTNEHNEKIHETTTKITQQNMPILKPPVKAERWLIVNAPHNHSAHRRAIFDIDGKLCIAQRFAVDMVKVSDGLKSFKTDGKTNEDYYCYGEPILAVSDGKIIKVVDDIKENKPGLESRAVEMNLTTIAGNYVVLQISKNVYVAYAHLIPGTIRVKEGDTVKPGDTIGRIGNSGNSTEPHLHLQVMNDPDFFRSEGIPFGFEDITLLSVMERTGKPPYGNHEMPPNLAIVKFGTP